MVKKLEAMARNKGDGKQLAAAVRESAQQIWLAGLGAFSKAQEEGGKVFEALVKEGMGIQRRTRAMTEERIGEVTGKMSKAAGDITRQATQSWDKLEQVFEDRVSRALARLGVPTSKDIQSLMKRVEALNESVQTLGGAAPARARKAAAARRPDAAKAPAKKAARRARAAS
ncbi:MAG: phasin family protein [Burkholderiaceae bacterium]|nr:phasin family protein [Burkholderiaceae bacterium]MEB2350490.1 phasin family protein [Burkholderiaceae bacterium]